MTDPEDLAKLLQVVRARYEVAQRSFRKIVTEEAALRDQLARLTDQDVAARSGTDREIRAIGADVLWNAWLGRARTRLNLRLAQVLARKERHVDQVRIAYGKVIVTENLLVDSRAEAGARHRRNALNRAIEHALTDKAPPQ